MMLIGVLCMQDDEDTVASVLSHTICQPDNTPQPAILTPCPLTPPPPVLCLPSLGAANQSHSLASANPASLTAAPPPTPTPHPPIPPPATSVNPLFSPCGLSCANMHYSSSTVDPLSQSTAATTPLFALPSITTASFPTNAPQTCPTPPHAPAAGPCGLCYDSCVAMDEDEVDSVQPMDEDDSGLSQAMHPSAPLRPPP